MSTRREWLATAGTAGLGMFAGAAQADAAADAAEPPRKVFRVGVLSARIEGQTQRLNGHCWQFTSPFVHNINMDAIRKYLDPGRIAIYEKLVRNMPASLGALPFPDLQVTHYYEQDPAIAALYAETFPGVQVATSPEQLAKEVDAVWLGDASGKGEDHFDLIAPALERGLPAFCDKPIGATVAGTRKILDFARQHKAPLMSSSLFRHQWGTEEALRMRDSGEFGSLQYVIASQGGGYNETGWFVYGQHPTWMAMTLCGAGVQSVSMYARQAACHALLTYPDRMPAEIWYGRPDVSPTYCSTSVHFEKKTYEYTPALAGNYWLGHYYQIFNMARVFRDMVKTRIEPIPHQEILEVTAIIHAGAKSLQEKSRLVDLAEVLG